MGRFQKGPQLGSGFSGVVFRARDTVTGDTVALKELKPGVVAAHRELLLARRISHLNVCRPHDLYIEDGRTLISMEFVDGETLQALMMRAGALPVDRALTIVRQILDGLEAAHRHGVIHRDLKPNNIMIARDGIVKIMDFGLARTQDVPAPDATNSDIAGTRGYIAPEQAIGQLPTVRTDLYSVGVILYEMISGKEIGRVNPSSIPNVPSFVETAIRRCLEMDPARRPASAAALRDALSRSRWYRPVPSYTAFLVTSLAVAIGLWTVIGRMKSEHIPRVESAADTPAPAAAPVPVPQELPTVAIVFDGPVGRAFADAVVQGKRFRVVDRSTVDRLFAELRRNRKDMDSATALQIGRVVGAKYFLIGNVLMYDGTKEIRINAQLIEAETTIIKISEGVSGKPENAEKLATELAERFHL